MAVDHAHAAGGHHAHDDENLDHQGNANMAVWLGLVALTFTTASFVGTNVYLRGWNPSKFDVDFSSSLLLKDLPYWNVLLMLISAVFLLIAGSFFAKNMWRAFNAFLALATLSFIALLVCEFNLLIWFANFSRQVATIYAPTETIQLLLTFLCVILLVCAGWYSSFGNKLKINNLFPVAMNVWLYTIFSGIIIFFIEDVMSFGQFAAWCGIHIS
jgi:uncharacterized membrane protein YozB (DUF420 family)